MSYEHRVDSGAYRIVVLSMAFLLFGMFSVRRFWRANPGDLEAVCESERLELRVLSCPCQPSADDMAYLHFRAEWIIITIEANKCR